MKPCEHVDSLLSAYLENETSPAETRFLEDHFSSCARCRDQKSEMRTLLTRIHSLPRVETSENFTQKVLAKTVGLEPLGVDFQAAARVRSRARAPWAVPLAAAAAVTILVLGVSQIRSPRDAGPVAAKDPAVQAPETFAMPAEQPANQPQTAAVQSGEVVSLGAEEEAVSLDAYVLDAYELRAPAGGGTPTLTRVAADTESKVVVTF